MCKVSKCLRLNVHRAICRNKKSEWGHEGVQRETPKTKHPLVVKWFSTQNRERRADQQPRGNVPSTHHTWFKTARKNKRIFRWVLLHSRPSHGNVFKFWLSAEKLYFYLDAISSTTIATDIPSFKYYYYFVCPQKFPCWFPWCKLSHWCHLYTVGREFLFDHSRRSDFVCLFVFWMIYRSHCWRFK